MEESFEFKAQKYYHISAFLTTGVENTGKHLPWQGWRQDIFDLLHKLQVGPSLPPQQSQHFVDNRFKLRNITLEKETFKHIDIITHITFLPLNHFSNWRNKTLTSHSWSWAGELSSYWFLEGIIYRKWTLLLTNCKHQLSHWEQLGQTCKTISHRKHQFRESLENKILEKISV